MNVVNPIYDSVFASRGVRVYSHEYVEQVRRENEHLKGGDIMYNICPQEGFQERVCASDAGILIIGGKRGGGKTIGALIAAARYIDNPNYFFYGFRRELDDIERQLWKDATKIYGEVATPTKSSYLWTFPSGASGRFAHLANEEEIDRRFRGASIPCMMIEELTQINSETFFTLLSSNRNSDGIPTRMIATCNPVGEKHWVHKMISWWIDHDTGKIIKSRDGAKRYFFKYGEDISEIIWGDTQEEVYGGASGYIDKIWDTRLEALGQTKYNLINSLTFIEGSYYENRIFVKNDPLYLSRLAGKGERQNEKDLSGIWKEDDDSVSLLTSSDMQEMFQNTEQRNGIVTCVIDVALSHDAFTIAALDGHHLFDLEMYKKVGSMAAVNLVHRFLEKHHIPLRRVIFDSDGIGNYLKEPLKHDKGGATAFNGNASATDKAVWQNLKSECAEKLVMRIREGGFSISPELLDRKFFGRTVRSYLEEDRQALRREITSNKFALIAKTKMKNILNDKRSPDILDTCIMSEYYDILFARAGGIRGLHLLKNF
jgi:hypothetical protein